MEEETFKYEIYYTGLFKKDFKKFLNDETKVKKITDTITLLKKGGVEALPDYMRPHKLTGNYKVISYLIY